MFRGKCLYDTGSVENRGRTSVNRGNVIGNNFLSECIVQNFIYIIIIRMYRGQEFIQNEYIISEDEFVSQNVFADTG